MTSDAYIAKIEEGFDALRGVCDPRGWDLLEELRKATVREIQDRDRLADAIKDLDNSGHSLRVVK